MKKTNNKGFSLVELIIVIAIMAVLIGVLAPQFIKYVEDARLQKDNSAIGEMANAMKIALTDEAVYSSIPAGGNLTVTLANISGTDTNKKITFATTGIEAQLSKVIGASFTTSSNTYKKATTDIVLTITADGKVSATGYWEKQDSTTHTKDF